MSCEEPPPVAPDPPPPVQKRPAPKKKEAKISTVRRVVTENELRALEQKDRELHFEKCIEILCRVNGKNKEYVKEDIKRKRALKVLKDFAAYKQWTPLPPRLSGVDHLPKFVLIDGQGKVKREAVGSQPEGVLRGWLESVAAR
jgi:hypothetical protein